jgi:hypothetical protein
MGLVETKIDRLTRLVEELSQNFIKLEKRINDLGFSCKIGFEQTRDAAHILREELAEAAGRMVEESWL